MKDKIFKALGFLRITDEKNQLSITNILVMIFAIKFAMVPMEAATVMDMAMALAAMGVYMGKKVVTGMLEAKKNVVPQEVMDKIKSMGK